MVMNPYRSNKNILYSFARVIVRLFAAIMLRFNVKYQSPLPPGPKLFVANHPSATDPFLIHLVTRDEVNVMITEKAFNVRFFGWFLRKVREIPVPLTLSGGIAAIEQACRHIEQGNSVAIFIEGHISPEEGGFLPPRAGAARLALSARVPVVPVGIYLRRNWRLNIRSGISGEQTEAFWYLHGPYIVTVGEPQYLTGDPESRESIRNASEQMMEAIKSLAYESEERGRSLMPSSLLVRFVRLLAPLRRKGMTAGF
jgi:1-acyl-sn-glycerol-3-phosphate acyltransferase